MKKNIFKKLVSLVVAISFSMLTTMVIAGSSIYSIIDSSTTINDQGCFSSKTFSMPKGEQIIMIHVPKAQSAGILYAVQHKKGIFFWSTTDVLQWNIVESTKMRYCSKTFSETKKDKYYYELTGISPDTLKKSGLSMTTSTVYVKVKN